jgi:hypothetical protein
MASAKHRSNILNSAFTKTGVGMGESGSGALYITQDFSDPGYRANSASPDKRGRKIDADKIVSRIDDTIRFVHKSGKRPRDVVGWRKALSTRLSKDMSVKADKTLVVTKGAKKLSLKVDLLVEDTVLIALVPAPDKMDDAALKFGELVRSGLCSALYVVSADPVRFALIAPR